MGALAVKAERVSVHELNHLSLARLDLFIFMCADGAVHAYIGVSTAI